MSVAAEPKELQASIDSTPLFIVIEGIDGCGKGMQLSMLKTHMEQHNRTVSVVHDPGTTQAGIGIRKLLLDGRVAMMPSVQALLYTAARASLRRHIGDLRRGNLDVLCGRWVMSTLVYQGVVQKVGAEVVQQLHEQWVKLDPDVYVVLDLPAEVAQERLKKRAETCWVEASWMEASWSSARAADRTDFPDHSLASPKEEAVVFEYPPHVDRFESMGVEFADQLRQGYRLFGEDMPNAWIVDANQAPENVFLDVLEACSLKCARFAQFFGGYHEAGED